MWSRSHPGPKLVSKSADAPICACLMSFRLEAAKDDYRIRCEELEKELLDVKAQNEELTSLADEAQSLKDEMDVLRLDRESLISVTSLKEEAQREKMWLCFYFSSFEIKL